MITRRAQIKRTTAPRKSRKARRGPWRSEKYRRWIADHCCLICGYPETQAAHTVNNGMSSKGPDSSCVPLCPTHHQEYDRNRAAFEIKHGNFDMQWYAVELFAQWRQSPKPEPECACLCVGDQADASGCEVHAR